MRNQSNFNNNLSKVIKNVREIDIRVSMIQMTQKNIHKPTKFNILPNLTNSLFFKHSILVLNNNKKYYKNHYQSLCIKYG